MEDIPGTFAKTSAVGFRARPVSVSAIPTRLAVSVDVAAAMESEPEREPGVVGVNATCTKHDDPYARTPPQAGPPVVVVLSAKLPVRMGLESMTALPPGVRFVRVKSTGGPTLWTGTEPKSCIVGVRSRPVRESPEPVRAME